MEIKKQNTSLQEAVELFISSNFDVQELQDLILSLNRDQSLELLEMLNGKNALSEAYWFESDGQIIVKVSGIAIFVSPDSKDTLKTLDISQSSQTSTDPTQTIGDMVKTQSGTITGITG